MNKQQAEKQFKDFILPGIKKQYEQDGVRDLPARQQEQLYRLSM